MFDDYSDIPFDVNTEEDEDIGEELYAANSGKTGPIDMITANYYVGLVKKNKAKAEEYEEKAKEMKDDFGFRVDKWLRGRLDSLDYSNAFYLGKLEEYFNQNPPEGDKKSISLPEGHIGFYKNREKYDFDTNEKEVIAMLESDPELKSHYLKYTPSTDKITLIKACSFNHGKVMVNGKEIPGAKYTPATTEFKAR